MKVISIEVTFLLRVCCE